MIVIASSNQNKLREFRNILPDFDFVLAKDIGIDLDIEENGTSFMENALIKAQAIHALTNHPVIADDSGLEIETLDGFPGIFSSRFAYPITEYHHKCQLILDKMQDRENRRACFSCAMVLITKDGNKYANFAQMEGSIGLEFIGEHGFGYDPIFIPDGYHITAAELTEEEKDLISHRGKALRGLFAKLPMKFIRSEKKHD